MIEGLIFLSNLVVFPTCCRVDWLGRFLVKSRAFKTRSQVRIFSAVEETQPVDEPGCCGGAGIVVRLSIMVEMIDIDNSNLLVCT